MRCLMHVSSRGSPLGSLRPPVGRGVDTCPGIPREGHTGGVFRIAHLYEGEEIQFMVGEPVLVLEEQLQLRV